MVSNIYSINGTKCHYLCWSAVRKLLIHSLTWSSNCAPCGLRGCKNRPAPFPGRMSYKATKPGLVCVLYLSMFYIVSLLIRTPGPFLCIVNFRWYVLSVFWLFYLSCHYLRSDWLERPLWGSLTVARGSSP